MSTITIIIEKGSDFFDACAENYEGVYGSDNRVEEARKNVLYGLDLLKESRPESEWPNVLKEE